MHEWIISYVDDEAFNEILKIGTVLFEPSIPNLKFIIMKSYLSKELIVSIEGVTECEEARMGEVYSIMNQ